MQDDPVAEFYSRHPYPPPVSNLDRARDEWRDPNRRRAEYHLFWPGSPYRADLKILVAGCGTWQAAKYALCHPDAQVVGIDVSATSIAHTDTLKQQYRLSNLEIRQLPLEQVPELQRQFDLIVSTGVIHHLADPDAGLRALAGVLEPKGALYLMVYAPYGRTGIYMLQEYCRRLGLGTSDQEICELIATLETLPQQHPLVSVLRGSRDARDADALADALLNPRDRAYSVPQLFEFIERNGFRFGRWYRQAPYRPQCAAIASTPHGERLAGLSPQEQFAAMELWRGTMTAHSVVVQRADTRASGTTIGVDDERWLRFVPIRLPWTRLIEERLPPGAAGVLLNSSHQFHDLVAVIDENEKTLFEHIDGRRAIGEIIDRSADRNHDRARTLFRKLWWYDQVVFDASGG
jgi:SAM-dependent methyltransferase